MKTILFFTYTYIPILFSCSNIRENTIASMNDAVLHGADMVEFDVQVIYSNEIIKNCT